MSNAAYRRDQAPTVRGPAHRPRHTPWPSTVIWRWRWELAIAPSAVLLFWAGWLTTGAWVLVILPIVVSSVLLIESGRRLVARRGAAIAVQHRLRVGFCETGLFGPDGGLPAILWTRVVPHGERVYLRCPPAVSVGDVRSERKRLARVCRATSVRATEHPRFARIIVLEVVRRGPDPAAEARSEPRPRVPRPRQALDA